MVILSNDKNTQQRALDQEVDELAYKRVVADETKAKAVLLDRLNRRTRQIWYMMECCDNTNSNIVELATLITKYAEAGLDVPKFLTSLLSGWVEQFPTTVYPEECPCDNMGMWHDKEWRDDHYASGVCYYDKLAAEFSGEMI